MSHSFFRTNNGSRGVGHAAFSDHGRALQETTVTSGFRLADGDYFARLIVGDEESREFYFLIDTGSFLTWMQCEPCLECYPQMDEPVYDPRRSTTFSEVDGRSEFCRQLPDIIRISGPESPTCRYFQEYGDQSTTEGRIVRETIAMDESGHSFAKVAFGCSERSLGTFNPTAGILALGRHSYASLPAQLRRAYNVPYRFSYCFPPMFSADTSTLAFGGPIPPNTVFTPLIVDPIDGQTHHLFVEILEISVGGTSLALPELGLFGIDPTTGEGGAFIDTGLTITELPQDAYEQVFHTIKDTIAYASPQLRRAQPYDSLGVDLCYLPRDSNVDESHLLDGVPSMAFHFAGGATLDLPPEHVIIPIQHGHGRDKRVCLSFSTIDDAKTIIGNVHQQRVRITFDMENERVGFTPPNAC
ncbi:hypothetical protein L7F22_051209 [Adiantum nelumboides]|nr:hypothetical protein [Adiantum nelumboides]